MGCTSRKRILFIRSVIPLTLLLILGYLIVIQIPIDTNFKGFLVNKSLVRQKRPNNEEAEFEQGENVPRAIRHRKKSKHRRVNRRNNRTRSFFYSREQIELTKIFETQPKICDNKRTRISIFINSRVTNFARRRMLRATWVKYARQEGICLYFLVGLNRHIKRRRKNWVKIEAKNHQDIIQGNFDDDYHNLTLKSITMLRWAHTHCEQDHFIMKVDDDVLLKIDRFLEYRHLFKDGINYLISNLFQIFYQGIYGRMTYRNASVTPFLGNYIPREYFGDLEYFPYLFGSAYLITANVIEALVKGIDSYEGYIIDIEDVFITGMLAEKLDIKRETYDFLHPAKCRINCSIAEAFYCWPCSGWELKRRWSQYQIKLNESKLT